MSRRLNPTYPELPMQMQPVALSHTPTGSNRPCPGGRRDLKVRVSGRTEKITEDRMSRRRRFRRRPRVSLYFGPPGAFQAERPSGHQAPRSVRDCGSGRRRGGRCSRRRRFLDFKRCRHHFAAMEWPVRIAEEFEPELLDLPLEVRRSILAHSRLLREFGPRLGRPHVDTLNGSRHANMKEMRFSAAGGQWRVAFAFDPERSAMLLVAGDKSGGSGRRFYRALVRKADERFDRHLARLAD